jgi:DNA-binding LacI/PurR family transcriptional regulator
MKSFYSLNVAQQLTEHLRDEILRGSLSGMMPGINHLAKTLGASPKTTIAAVKQLELEGLLVPQGPRRRSKIVLPKNLAPPTLRVQILLYEPDDAKLDYAIELLRDLQEAGHATTFATKSLLDLGMDPKRVARFVKKTETDAWVVFAGSREVLEWFAAQPVPTFALFGRHRTVPIASFGSQVTPPLVGVTQRLIKLGHQRIVMLVREERRKPVPGGTERVFLQELEAAGIQSGPYNLPNWQDNPAGFHQGLDSLFLHTPPTALIIDTPPLVVATLQYFGQRGIAVPRDVSLVALDSSPGFSWCEPAISHIRFDHRPLMRRIVRWTNNIARGKDDRRAMSAKAEFIEGGTIGPAPKGRRSRGR